MTIGTPINLYDLYNELNEANCDPDVNTTGHWQFGATVGPTPPLPPATTDLCVSADGVSYSVVGYLQNQIIINVGTHNPWVDLSGASCGCAAVTKPDTISFLYVIPAQAGCAAQTRGLTVNRINNNVTIQRIDSCNNPAASEATMYEMLGVNPVNASNTAPNLYMQNNWVTPSWDIRLRVDRRNIEGCVTNGNVYNQVFTLGTTTAEYLSGGGNFNLVFGPKLVHSMASGNINIGGCFKAIRIGGVTYTLNIERGGTINQLATDVRNALLAALPANSYGLSVTGSGTTITVQTLCANSATWVGIDKSDGFIQWTSTGGCGGTAQSNTVVTQTISGGFTKLFSGEYTTPCGTDIGTYTDLCPNRVELEIIDASASNYNSIVLQNVSGRRYYIYDEVVPGETGVQRQAICQEVTVNLGGTGCSGPVGPADLYWQNAGNVNPKVFEPLEQDVAVSDCSGCIAEKPFCYPEARDSGHSGSSGGLNCSKTTSVTYELPVGSSVDKCGGGAVTMSALTVHDVPAAFSSCTTNPATQRITSILPANSLPRTYYVAWRWRGPDNEWSNYALKRYNLLKNDCCT